MERKLLFNNHWMFTKQDITTRSELPEGADIMWSEVDLPHDWLIYNTNNLYESGEGWYRKDFVIEELSGRVISIYFEGVYMDSTVFVNGQKAGEWKYGYSSFEFDVTGLLKEGMNEILVKVVHKHPNSRWYSGAGIYRNVWLKTTAPVHLITNGIYAVTRKEADGWYVELETETINQVTISQKSSCLKAVKTSEAEDRLITDAQETSPLNAFIKHTILDSQGNEVAASQNQTVITASVSIDQQKVLAGNPELWSLEKPYLYTLKTQIIVEGKIVDEEAQKIGFRTTRFDSKEGFFLNDRHVKLQGANEHHDLGSLGAAMNRTALRRKLILLKEMGVNAIRTSHNMPAVELMELADEMGILILSEAFDMWERQKTDYDYSRYFNEWCGKDVASWVRRDRNHPSLIMWSIGNEIYDTHADERGLVITKMLKALVLQHDPKKNGQVTIGSNYMIGENAQKCADEVQAAGYNYAESLYQEHHDKYPDWYIFGSETGSNLQSRGIYHFPADKSVVMYEDEQCSSLDNCSASWGSKSAVNNIIYDRDTKFSLGQFIWTGFDYIGEPTPYTTKNSYYGQIDTAGFKKDAFYLYQAEWTDYRINPMVHVLPYWDFNPGQLIDILVYSNAPKVELFLNENSLGSFDIDHIQGKELVGRWQLPYQTGTLKAIAYDENGRVIATDSQSSFGDAAAIVLRPDKTELKADGQDLIFVEISMKDADGFPVSNANNRVEVEINGAGRLIGLDNGDSTDYDQYKGTSRRLFSGKLLAIIAAKTEPGEVHVKVTSKGLQAEELILTAVPGEIIQGISAEMENDKSETFDEIPIRKIELTNHGMKLLSKENTITTVSAKLLPVNTTYRELEWKAVTASGVPTNIAQIEVNDGNTAITALGDGEFRLRCTAKNGKNSPQIISELEFEITGMGAATISPYQLIDAALYNLSNGEIESGLMGGINTRDGVMNVIGYKGLDFGDYGSDEVTLPVCYWGNNPIPLEIWEGYPGEEEAKLLLKTNYQADWIWATFLPNTFKLPKRLKGITTVSFVLYDKANIKGFEFTYTEKAFEKLSVKDNNQLYGDSYTITEDAIEHIGNNVSIEFDNMDFGKEGTARLVICGRSHTDNTLHIRFEGESPTVSQIAEFPYTTEYEEREFLLDKVIGRQKVNFVFLPGCNFDFQWFRFEK